MSDITAPPPVAAKGRATRGVIQANLRQYGMLLSLFAIMLFFEIATSGTLLRPLNLTNLILQNSYVVVMALGMLEPSVGVRITGASGAVLSTRSTTYPPTLDVPAASLALADRAPKLMPAMVTGMSRCRGLEAWRSPRTTSVSQRSR